MQEHMHFLRNNYPGRVDNNAAEDWAASMDQEELDIGADSTAIADNNKRAEDQENLKAFINQLEGLPQSEERETRCSKPRKRICYQNHPST